MRSKDILIVDDEIGIREVLQETLEDEGYTVALAENAQEARRLRNQTRPAMVLLDIWMPDSDGITLLKEWAKNGQLNMPVVMMSGHGSIDTAVEATKIGALDFLEKPIPLQKLLATVERALKYGESQNNQDISLDKLGKSDEIKELKKQVQQIIGQKSPVLLLGEAGSPFEIVARTFHKNNTPWITPTRPEQITEIPIELLSKAGGGVLYLGDIGQYSKHIQQNIGFIISKSERYNTRVICTSTQSLDNLMDIPNQDTRLLDLLSNWVIHIPALRQQIDDIQFIVEQMAIELSQKHRLDNRRFNSSAVLALRQYDWPGNWEQLNNVVNHLIINSEQQEIGGPEVAKMLSQLVYKNQLTNQEFHSGFNFDIPLRELREQLEKQYFEYHIQQENGNMSRVAQKVGLERTHLYRKLKQLGISFNNRRHERD